MRRLTLDAERMTLMQCHSDLPVHGRRLLP